MFNSYNYQDELDSEIISDVNREIKNVIINIGQFNFMEMSYELANTDINDLLNKINVYKQEIPEIPDEMQVGEEIFSGSDINSMINADYIIIPSISSIGTSFNENYYSYESLLNIDFSILDIRNVEMFEEINIAVKEFSRDLSTANEILINSLKEQLDIEIKNAFSMLTEVIGIRNNEIDISLIENRGIKQGYELILYNDDSSETVLIVKDTGEQSSIAALLYGPVSKNTFFEVIPRAGFELTPYFNITIDNLNDFDVYTAFGIKVSWTKGLYVFRPFICLEFPMPFTGSYLKWLYDSGVPVISYFGGEFSLVLGRLQILTQAAFGTHFFIPNDTAEGQKRYLTHLGGYINSSFSVLINKRIKLCLDFGYKIWVCPFDTLFGETSRHLYGGIMFGGGITIKI